jgi:nitroimidazol reductase NimA-like FMN-containing flavoprotein (pyridoxamine 5'-phosphate oxidase superfamily)
MKIKGGKMRRDEFDIKDKKELAQLLDEAGFGTLGLNDEPSVYMTGVNFVFKDDSVYFHGAADGRKYSLALARRLASFSVVKEYSFIPSHFFGHLACPATQYFSSAFLEGEISFIEDRVKKTAAFEALMNKYQNDGGYEPFNSHMYDKMLAKTAVFRLKITSFSLKIKAGQNLSKEQSNALIERLKTRGTQKDLETVELIRRVRPKDN